MKPGRYPVILRLFISVLFFVFSLTGYHANALVYSNPNFLKTIFDEHGVRVTISDKVKDGCWSKPQETKSLAIEVLTRNGIKSSENSPITLQLEALGFQVEERGCIVTYEFKLGYLKLIEDRVVEGLLLLAHSSGFNAGRGDRGDQINESLAKFIGEIAQTIGSG